MEQKREFVEIIFTNDIGRALYNTRELTYSMIEFPLICGKKIVVRSPKNPRNLQNLQPSKKEHPMILVNFKGKVRNCL